MPSVPKFSPSGRKHQECTRHYADARLGLDDLESRAEHIAGSVHRTCYLTVGIAGFHHEAAEVKRIGGGEASLLHADTFALAQLEEQGSVFVDHCLVGGVDYFGILYVLKFHFLSHCHDISRITDKHYFSKLLSYDTVSSRECARLGAFGQNNPLGIGFCLYGHFLNKFHFEVSDFG